MKKILQWLVTIIELIALDVLLSLFMDGEWIPSVWISLIVAVLFIIFHKKLSWKSDFKKKFFVLLFLLVLLHASINWGIKTFPLHDSYAVIMTLLMPLTGFSFVFVRSYIVEVLIPVFFVAVFVSSFLTRLDVVNKNKKKIFAILVVLTFGWNALIIGNSLPVNEYVQFFMESSEGETFHSKMYAENFVLMDTNRVAPVNQDEKTRNLIFIIMESMETSFSDSVFQKENLIRELVSLKKDEYNFSENEAFGGGEDTRGSWNTISAIVSKTTGCPLLMAYSADQRPLPRVVSVYDIIRKFGYYNVFLQGTDGDFEGKRPFLMSHGIDELYDMEKLKDYQDLDEKYRHFEYEQMVSFDAGITDRSLLNIAKRILDTLAQKDHFSLSILTMETHFPYGFYNEQCGEGVNHFSNESLFRGTIRCASKDVRAFIEWVKQQPFYENTEIVVVGDHLFMGEYLVQKDYDKRQWIDIFINPQLRPTNLKNRKFTSADIAPSILESMGFEIANHRMGFGVSLFSDQETLLEKRGRKNLYSDLKVFERSVEYKLLSSPANE